MVIIEMMVILFRRNDDNVVCDAMNLFGDGDYWDEDDIKEKIVTVMIKVMMLLGREYRMMIIDIMMLLRRK